MIQGESSSIDEDQISIISVELPVVDRPRPGAPRWDHVTLNLAVPGVHRHAISHG